MKNNQTRKIDDRNEKKIAVSFLFSFFYFQMPLFYFFYFFLHFFFFSSIFPLFFPFFFYFFYFQIIFSIYAHYFRLNGENFFMDIMLRQKSKEKHRNIFSLRAEGTSAYWRTSKFFNGFSRNQRRLGFCSYQRPLTFTLISIRGLYPSY